MKFKSIIILSICLFWAGCGNDAATNNANNQSNANAANNVNKNAANAQNTNSAAMSEKLILSSEGKSETHPCNGREVEIDQEATASKYTLTGECKKLTVDGVSNQVKVDKVGEIVAKGVSNKIVYGEGIDGKKPKITKSGPSTVVESVKEKETREKAEENKTKANTANQNTGVQRP